MQRAGVTQPRCVPVHKEAAGAHDALRIRSRGKRQSSTCSTPRVTARRDGTHTQASCDAQRAATGRRRGADVIHVLRLAENYCCVFFVFFF